MPSINIAQVKTKYVKTQVILQSKLTQMINSAQRLKNVRYIKGDLRFEFQQELFTIL